MNLATFFYGINAKYSKNYKFLKNYEHFFRHGYVSSWDFSHRMFCLRASTI